MNTPITPWIDLMLHQAQRCHHLAWFLLGCLEREHVLNVDAFVAWWARGTASPASRLPLSAAARRAPVPASSASAMERGPLSRGNAARRRAIL